MPKKSTAAPSYAVMRICVKCSDRFTATFIDPKDKEVGEYEGYVPDFFPGEHYGDYVILDIDLATGRIVNWKRPTIAEIEKLITKD